MDSRDAVCHHRSPKLLFFNQMKAFRLNRNNYKHAVYAPKMTMTRKFNKKNLNWHSNLPYYVGQIMQSVIFRIKKLHLQRITYTKHRYHFEGVVNNHLQYEEDILHNALLRRKKK